jgi:CheY-like chemotaxis protein
MPGRRVTQATVEAARHVLLIDDNPVFQERMKALLEQEGFCVTCLPDHATAFRALEDKPFTLIVSDDHIARPSEYSSGEAWCRAYRGQGGRVPVILVTGADLSRGGNLRAQGEAITHLAATCGADWVIPKAIIEAPQGDALFLQYAKDLALDAQTARSIGSKIRGL